MKRTKRYRVDLTGQNLLLDVDGIHCCFNLIASRWLPASTAEQAGKTALIRLHQELQQRQKLAELEGRPLALAISCVEEVGWLTFFRKKNRADLDFSPIDDENIQPRQRGRWAQRGTSEEDQ